MEVASVVKNILQTKIQVLNAKIQVLKLMLLSNCVICGKSKSTFVKNKARYNFND